MAIFVGVDLGTSTSRAKILFSNKKKKSICVSMPTARIKIPYTTQHDEGGPVRHKRNDEWWLLGDDAITHSIFTQGGLLSFQGSTQRFGSDLHQQILGALLHEANIPTDEDVYLGFTIPPSLIALEPELVKWTNKYHTSYERITYEDDNGTRKEWEPAFIGLRPEGHSIFYNFLLNDSGGQISTIDSHAKGNVAIVDPGTDTTDIARFSNGRVVQSMMLDATQAGSGLRQYVYDPIARSIGIRGVTAQVIEQATRYAQPNGHYELVLGDRKITITDALHDGVFSLMSVIHDTAMSMLGDAEAYSRIIIAGGRPDLYHLAIQQLAEQVGFPANKYVLFGDSKSVKGIDPWFANASGTARWLFFNWKRSKKL